MEQKRRDFGVLYGQKTTEDALLIYSSYEDSKASPQTGDFIVLAQRDEVGRKFLARVEAEIYDEDPIFRSQDKTLVAVHYARIAERELSKRDKQKMFSYTYKVKILGTFSNDGYDFSTAVRKLPTVSYHARHLNKKEFEKILNKTNENGIKLGNLCVGDDVMDEREVLFDIKKLRANRTMVFAQSGFGKTNLMKVLISRAFKDEEVGKLIFDLEGEYFLKSSIQKTYGIADIDHHLFRDNLVVYTDKKIPDNYNDKFIEGGEVKVDFSKDFNVGDIISTAIGLTNAGRNFLEYLSSLPDQSVVQKFFGKVFDESDPTVIREFAYKNFSKYFQEKKKQGVEDDIEANVSQASKSMLGGVIRQIRGYTSIHKKGSDFVSSVLKYLSQNKTVIVDFSLLDNNEASLISTVLVKRLFEHNKSKFTIAGVEDSSIPGIENAINAVIFVEEAQNVLSDEFVRSNANPFIKVAKQGRKFSLGLVAITQRPSAISEEIRSQAENFFVLHMGNSKDIKALVESNINYSGVISKFIQSETIPGNLYMVSAKQSFAIPLKVNWFEELIHNNVYKELKFSADDYPELLEAVKTDAKSKYTKY
ncbi:MAG: ATP-binding protein [Ekhidna sp.]|nr:ATP-binding protein [Ekhidna sp.]